MTTPRHDAVALRLFASDVEAELAGRRDRSLLVRAIDRALGLFAGLVGSANDVVAVEVDDDAGLPGRQRLRAQLLELGVACARPIAFEREAGRLHWTSQVAATEVEAVRPWAWTPRSVAALLPLLRAREDVASDVLRRRLDAKVTAGRTLGDKGQIAALRAAIGSPGGALYTALPPLLSDWAAASATPEIAATTGSVSAPTDRPTAPHPARSRR